MTAFVKEFHGESNSAGNGNSTTTVTVPVGGVAAGHSLIFSVVTWRSGSVGTSPVGSIIVDDQRGNNYTEIATHVRTGVTTAVTVIYANIVTPLEEGDVLELTPDLATGRFAVSVFEFDSHLAFDVYEWGESAAGSTLNWSVGPTPTTSQAESLIVGSFAFINPERTFTPGAGYTAGTRVTTTNGTGDRSVIGEWMNVSSVGQYIADGTINISGQYAGMVSAFYEIDEVGGGRSGRPRVWNGTEWAEYPAKVWNGTEWVEKPMKGWNGATWIDSK